MGKHWKPSKVAQIDPVWRGIFVTCNRGRESQCAREIREWWEQTAELLCPEDESGADLESENTGNKKESSIEDDIEAEINAEVEALKTKRKHIVVHEKLGVECVLFVQTRYPVDPIKLVLKVVEECKNKERHAKYIQKITPIQKFVKFENMESLEQVIQESLAENCTFAIRPSLRFCEQTRDVVIPAIAKLVGTGHKVDLKNYDSLIVVEGFKTIIGVGVLNLTAEEMKSLCQLNLQQLTQKSSANLIV